MTDHENPQFGPMRFETIEDSTIPDDTVYLLQNGKVTVRITGIGDGTVAHFQPAQKQWLVQDALKFGVQAHAMQASAPKTSPYDARIPLDLLSEVARFLFVRVGLDDDDTKAEARRLRGQLFDILQHARGI